MADAMIGRLLNDRYKITELIGTGGMAEVYRAQDVVLGRTVAIKIMLPQYAADASFAQKFKQEAASAANLSSPYIVNVYDWGQDHGTSYIVMEFMRGTDLKSGINARGALNQRKVAEIGSQVCAALQVAHNLDIIHCDIKPQNIMVQPDGNAKVMDFGISKAKNSLEAKTSTVLGTAHYISPEQAQGKDLTAASDIYSLGIVLYEAATGKLPFDGPDAISVATKQVQEEAIPPGDINPKLDPQLEAIIMKAINKDPRKRYATAGEMRAALNDFLSGRKQAMARSSQETAVIGSNNRTQIMRPNPNMQNAGGSTIGMTAVLPTNQSDFYDYDEETGMKPANPHNYRAGQNGSHVSKNANGAANASSAPSRRNVIIGVLVAVVVVILAGVLAFRSCSAGANEVAVPNVTGKTAAEATDILEENGFEVGTVDKSYDSEAEPGTVIKQDPDAGSMKPEGSKINLVVSLGAEDVIVPNLENMTAAEAQAALQKAGLVAHAGTAEYSSEVDVNKVISQNPAANSTVKKGGTVEYVLSLGAENVSVPNVVGQTQSSASSTLESNGFKVSVKESYSDSVSSGVVISQSPDGGKLEKGELVVITVSKGQDPAKAPVQIPQVVGKSVADASSALESAGFSVSITGDNSPGAVVVEQSMTGTATKGTSITIKGELQSNNG